VWTLTLQLFLLAVLPTNQTDRTSLLGIDLRPEAQELLREVGELYGRSVQIEVVESLPGHGVSSILADGTPLIRINSVTGRTERNIVHELLHLKLAKEGFATIDFKFPGGVVFDQTFGEWIINNINDPILHFILYPKMREMGLDPAILLNAKVEEDIERGDYEGLTGSLAERESEVRTVGYFEAVLELNDEQLLYQLEQWYEEKDWTDSLAIGKRLAEIVSAANPQTPEAHIETLISCMNAFYKNKILFQFKEWTSSMMGTHKQKIAVITVHPPR